MNFDVNELKFRLAQSDLFLELRELPLRFQSKTSYSQHGEDSFLLKEVFAGKSGPGTYVDIGASHPVRISNTYLLYRMGWTGVIVEPISRLVKLHKRWRPRDTQVQSLIGTIDGTARFYSMFPSVLSTASDEQYRSLLSAGYRLIESIEMRQLSLRTLLSEYATGHHVDFMNIDIEGLDHLAAAQLAELDDLELPKCVCIECNDGEPEKRVRQLLTPRYKNTHRLGANLIMWNKIN
jgi:hypothetical protein